MVKTFSKKSKDYWMREKSPYKEEIKVPYSLQNGWWKDKDNTHIRYIRLDNPKN